jgi:ABC-type phosphate transport system auxiliary subunit
MNPEDLCGTQWDEEIQECLARFEKLEERVADMKAEEKSQLNLELENIRKKRAALWEKYKLSRQSEESGIKIKSALLEMQEALDRSFYRFRT